jgi:tRNA(fMet)-specific endonuclease VapC
MFVLDTDHLSFLDRPESELGLLIRNRLDAARPAAVATTIVNFEEQTRGRFAFLARAKSMAQLLDAYGRLESHLKMYCSIPVLSFDAPAAAQFESLRQAKLKIGTMDLRIAAIVLSRDATLISRNLRDFQQVPGLRVEDWTIETAR